MRSYFLFTIFSCVFAYEKDITFTVQAGKTDCFYQNVLPNEIIDLEYQVIDATHGELDISFQLSDPVGRIIIADYKKAENAHRHTAALNGDYRFCFDNTFSTFSQKTVFLDIMIDTEDNREKDYDDDKEMELGTSAESYMMRIRDISESVTRVKDNMAAARRLQELHSAHEARDRNRAEEMCANSADQSKFEKLAGRAQEVDIKSSLLFRVMSWSLWQIVLMLAVGITQVIFLKSLFEDPSTRDFKKLIPGLGSQ